MPQTEIQLPTKDRFYNDIQSIAGEIRSRMERWRLAADFLASMDATDLDALGVPTGDIRIDLVEFRIVLNEVVSLLEGNAVTPTYNPSTVLDKVRKILVL